jgi:SAM-dependent methyltransferase
MDQPDLDADRHVGALRGLERINFFSGSSRILWPPIRDLARQMAPRPVRVVDIASGGGDVSLGLARRAGRAGLAIGIEGWDLSPLAVDYATRKAEREGVRARFTVHNVLSEPLPTDADVFTASLFLHHLDEPDAVALLRRAGEATRHLVLINDLIRSPTGLVLAHVASRLLTLSPVVHIDGPRSVESAFTMTEARQLAERAGLAGATVQWRWPFRYLLAWRRP